ncbi:MAG TPA: hypothetical protein VNY27_07020 [Solirubrobacteraceae bacterium]|jgi:hypothetical protein|nr:hypothetical protein [Solirubrobacteraceae bacterium]
MYGSYGFTPDTPEPLDWELLQLLVDDFEHRPWTAAEIVNRTHEEPAATLASLERLRRSDLIGWPYYWVMASRPAIYYSRIAVRPDGPPPWSASPA